MDEWKQKLEKLDERVGSIDVTLARVDERLIHLQETLEAHDAKAVTAIHESGRANRRITEIESYAKVPLKIAVWIRNIGLAAGLLYVLVEFLRGVSS